MILRLALTLFFATNVSAFFVTPTGVTRRPFVSLQVSLSDSSPNTELPLESPEDADKPTEELSVAEESVVETASEIEGSSTAETAVDAVTVKAETDESKGPSKSTERFTLYVGNLPFAASVVEIRNMFAEHVDVRYVSLPKNRETGIIKGFAFIDVGSAEDIPKAVDALNGKEMEGRPLRVSLSLKKGQVRSAKQTVDGSQKLYIGNVPFASTQDELREYFTQYSEVIDIFIPVNSYGEPRGFAFLTVKKEDADAVIKEADGAEFMGRTLLVNLPLPPGEKTAKSDRQERVKLFVGNLSFFTTSETLIEVFEEFGSVYDCYIPMDTANGNSRGFGFVTMYKDAAQPAIDALDGCELDGRPITVNEAKPRTPRGEEAEEEETENDADSEVADPEAP